MREKIIELLWRRAFSDHDRFLIDSVRRVVEPYGCLVIGLGPEAVNVIGDARAYQPCVIVEFPAGMAWEEIGRISTDVTNRVRVSRVLMQIATALGDRDGIAPGGLIPHR